MDQNRSDSTLPDGERVILFHGFSQEELSALVTLLKGSPRLPEETILATTTETSLEWKVQDLIRELSQEHRFFHPQRG